MHISTNTVLHIMIYEVQLHYNKTEKVKKWAIIIHHAHAVLIVSVVTSHQSNLTYRISSIKSNSLIIRARDFSAKIII